MMKRRVKVGALFSLSLLLLFNPNINLLDVFPDCIAYFMLIYAIGDASESVPYLAECKSALGKLALITLIKIPAFFMMYSNLVTGRDIIPMFTLIFVVLEAILLYSAVSYGYKALAYIGERTDVSISVKPFVINKKGSVMTQSSLKILTLGFFLGKGMLNLLPELLLLTPEEISLRRKLQEAYPTVLLVCILAGLTIGIIWYSIAKKYVKALRETNELTEAISSLKAHPTKEEELRISKTKSLTSALSVLSISSLFSVDITFSDFGDITILPHFIYGIILLYVMYALSENKKMRTLALTFTGVFTLTSILSHVFLSTFLDKYGYLYLLYSSKANEAYIPVKAASVIEAISIIALLYISSLIFKQFITKNTAFSPSDERYSVISKKTHKSLYIRGYIMFGLAGLINVLKCINVFLKGNAKLEFTAISDDGFVTGTLPWFSTLIFGICVIYIIYSFCFIYDVKSEVKFKYSSDRTDA